MRRISMERFEAVYEMLLRRFGDQGQKVFFKMVKILGEGERVVVPKVFSWGLQSVYYWNPHRDRHIMRWRQMLDMMREALGASTGEVTFRDCIIELGQSERITVPYLYCGSDYCGRCKKVCLYRKKRNEKIRNQFRGNNHKELGLLWGLSERQIRRIVNGR